MEIQPFKNIENLPVVDDLSTIRLKWQGMKHAIFDMNFITFVCTFKKDENDTMASYNYQLIDIPL